jgi:tRNA G18 (ribose-2'-O)-methylase SpoU
LFETDLTAPTAFVLGAEGAGLPLGLLQQMDETVTIPMRPPVESLNVAVAAALLFYEAMRQRSREGVKL